MKGECDSLTGSHLISSLIKGRILKFECGIAGVARADARVTRECCTQQIIKLRIALISLAAK